MILIETRPQFVKHKAPQNKLRNCNFIPESKLATLKNMKESFNKALSPKNSRKNKKDDYKSKIMSAFKIQKKSKLSCRDVTSFSRR